MKDFLPEAKRIVREAGLMAREILPRSKVIHYKKLSEPVTEGDIRVEEYVISSLKKQFPNHGFDSEEMGKKNPKAEYVWILDPIDGTKYYAKDIPLYSVSLALAHHGKLVLGVVYSPEFDRMYCASEGNGATMNNLTIRGSGEEHLKNASICLEIPSKNSPKGDLQWALGKISNLIEQAFRVRIIGVGSLGLCFCATGGFDAYVNLGCIWKYCDHAAGQIILQEAGGEFSYVGEQGEKIIAGPAVLCNEIRALIGL